MALIWVAPAAASVDVKANFQPDLAPVPGGYVKDNGAAYDAARGFGWVREDSLAFAAHTPLDLTLNTRQRNTVADLRQDTFIHMQFPASSTATGTKINGAWELDVPSGSYAVTVGVGDASYFDSVHQVNVENQAVIPNFTPTSADRFRVASATVTVTDGRLTLDAIGGTNTKLDFITVQDADSTPPAKPTSVTATPDDGSVALDWAANTEPDLAGYRVYRGTTAPVDTTGTPISGTALLTAPTYVDTTAVNGKTYHYVVEAADQSGNRSTLSDDVSATPQAPPPAPSDLAVNFQTQSTTAPAGYAADYGQAFDATRGYGWVDAVIGAPLSLVGNGRERNVAADKRLDTFVSMQLKVGSAGIMTPGSWKATLPNGTYKVTVAAGDPSYTDSHHVLNVEGQPAIDFTPTTTATAQTNTVTVDVTDGSLDVDATGGLNTKINYLRAVPTTATAPRVTAVTPADGESNVCRDGAITVQLSDGVDPTTATASGLQVLTPGGSQVSGFYNTDGAYSNVTFVPGSALAANSTYTVRARSLLKDPLGNAYKPFTSTFTTGPNPCAQQADVNFSTSTFDYSDGTAATTTAYKTAGPTALALGPNPSNPTQLWAAFGTGNILVYNLDPATGRPVGTPTQVGTFKFQRLVSGLRFDPSSTASNIKLWVSNGQFGCDLAAIGVACDDFTGGVSTLTGSSLSSLIKTDIVTGLPRSVGNHMNNGVDFGPDGALYLAQGAENGYGAPDAIWGNRSEDPLSAAVLRIDVAGITNPPYNVNTSTGYDANAAGAKVTLYATGIRNPFSLLWHSNGKLYAPVNESANGDTPADPAGGAPALTGLPAMNDYFTQVVKGKYYGHPNPARGEYRLNGANPTAGVDPFEVPQYPVGTQPNANWRQPDLDLGVHRSANASGEFKSTVFGSTLKGQVLVTEYSQGKDIIAIKLDANGKAVSKSVVAAGFYNPLPMVIDNATGRVYVGEYGRDPDGVGGKLTLLTPNPVVAPPAADGPVQVTSPEDVLGLGSRMVFSTVRNQARTGHSLTLKNMGTTAVRVTNLAFGGTDAADFQLCSGQAATLTIAAGASAPVCVQYRPTVTAAANGTQVSQGKLTITTNDPAGPYDVTLGGLNSKDYEGDNEPSLQRVFDALGYKNDAAVTDKPYVSALSPASTAVGDEVLSPYWLARDTTKPVTLLPIARYAGKLAGADSPRFGWHAKGSATTNYLYAFPGGNSTAQSNDGYGQNQLLLPTTTTSTPTFTPAGSFGLADEMGWHSDDALNAGAEHWHNYRFFPAKDAGGAVIPGAYLVGEDIFSPVNNSYKNWDYQDYAFVLLNAKPDTSATQPTAGEVAKTLAGFPGNAGGINGTGFSTAQGSIVTNRMLMFGGRLYVTSSSDTNTSHTNALQLGVNAGTGFRVQSRLVGPFTSIDAGAEQQGIYWGPNGNNHLKAEVRWDTATRRRVLDVWMEQNGIGSIVQSVPLPGGNANTIDLRFDVQPSPANNANPFANVSYALNGATTFTALNTAPIAIPTSWVTANTPAGIVTSHQQGGRSFLAAFASFSVARGY